MPEKTTLDKKIDEALMRIKAGMIKRLLSKGLKVTWTGKDFIGFLAVIASLNAQTKDWKFPSDHLYDTLDPQSLSVLVICLQEKKQGDD